MTTHEPVPGACVVLHSVSSQVPLAGNSPKPDRGVRPFATGVFCRLARIFIVATLSSASTAAAQIPASDSDPRLSQAAELVQRGAVSEAIPLLEAVLEARPRDVDALLTLGSALSLIPRRNEAVKALLRAIELSPEEGRVHASAGAALARLGEQDAALQVFERAISLDPELGDAHVSIALILAAREQFERSAEHLAQALSLESDQAKLARLHFLNGKLHVERGHVEAAEHEFERSVALHPGSGESHLALGLARKRLLREDEAYPMFQKAVELAPENAAAHYQLGLELQRRADHEAAAEHFRRAHELQPDDRSVVYNLTRALHKAGRGSESLQFREMLARMIESGDRARENELETARLHGEAVRLENAGNYTEALDRYRALLRIEPLNTVTRRNLALVLCRLGRWNEGIEELEAILLSNPDDAETARTLVIVLDEARRSGAAIDWEAVQGPPGR